MALERMDPQHLNWIERGVMQEHLQRYEFAATLLVGPRVLDAACGTGYGTNLLAGHLKGESRQAIGIDISPEAVELARSRATDPVIYEVADVSKLPFDAATFDTLVSFETIEHLPKDRIPVAIADFARVLKPGGRLIISTPDRRSYSLGGTTGNQFHEEEFTHDEFVALLTPHFVIETVYGQKFSQGWTLVTAQTLTRFLGHGLISKLWRAYKMVICRDARVIAQRDRDGQIPMLLVVVASKKSA